MINIQELLAASKAKENNQLVKGVWFLIQWSPDDYSQERFNIGVAFSSERGEKQVKFTKSFKELSNWYGGNLTKQGDMVIKIATHTFIGKSLDKFSSGFFESGIHYVPMGMAQCESIEKIMNVLFKDVVPMAQEKQNIARASYTTTRNIITVVREAISKNSVLKDIMPENPMVETLSGISVKVPIQFRSNAGTIVSADYATSDTVENELLRSFRDIDLILNGNDFDNVNSFLLLPASAKGEAKKISNLISDYTSSLKSKGVETISAHQPSSLVNKIDGWYKEVA